ncbi:MAG: hypothetical protein ACYC3G_03085, partial [Minisyncoccota bacterium]
FPIGMATGYSEVEIGYGEYIGYHRDSKKLFVPASSNNGTAVIQDHCKKLGVMIKKNQFLSNNQKGRGTKPST